MEQLSLAAASPTVESQLEELSKSMELTFDSLVCSHSYKKLEARCVICQTFSLGLTMAADTSIVRLPVKLENVTQQKPKSHKKRKLEEEGQQEQQPKSRIKTPIPWWFSDGLLFALLCRRPDSGPPESEKEWYEILRDNNLMFVMQGL